MRSLASPLPTFLVLAAVLAPLLVVGATVLHTHDGPGIGLYNQEHDLVLMGALGSIAPLPALVVAVAVIVTAWVIAASPLAPHSGARRLDVSRAPPTA